MESLPVLGSVMAEQLDVRAWSSVEMTELEIKGRRWHIQTLIAMEPCESDLLENEIRQCLQCLVNVRNAHTCREFL